MFSKCNSSAKDCIYSADSAPVLSPTKWELSPASMRHSQLILITEYLWGYRGESPLDSLLQLLCSACPSMVLLDSLHLQRNLNFDLKPGYPKGFLVSYRTHQTSFSSKESHHHYQKKTFQLLRTYHSLNHFLIYSFPFPLSCREIWRSSELTCHKENQFWGKQEANILTP